MLSSLKVLFTWVVSIGIRLLPFRAPNLEPILASQMPLAKRYGSLAGFVYGSGSIIAFDALTKTGGQWSWSTALTYGVIGAVAPLYFRNRNSLGSYATFAIISTLFFDGVTGVLFGPLVFNQTFMQAFLGQIPFTMLHLFGNVALAVTASPLLYKWYAADVPEMAPTADLATEKPLA